MVVAVCRGVAHLFESTVTCHTGISKSGKVTRRNPSGDLKFRVRSFAGF